MIVVIKYLLIFFNYNHVKYITRNCILNLRFNNNMIEFQKCFIKTIFIIQQHYVFMKTILLYQIMIFGVYNKFVGAHCILLYAREPTAIFFILNKFYPTEDLFIVYKYNIYTQYIWIGFDLKMYRAET